MKDMEIRKTGIVGAGVMGSQIAEMFLKNYLDVVVCLREGSLNKGDENFKDKSLSSKLKRTTKLEDLSDRDFILECVSEDEKSKREVFEKLDMICKNGTVIASNTSSLLISSITKNCKNKSRMLGVHFLNPVSHMKMVEVVKAEFTSEKTLLDILEFLGKIGKEPLVVKDTAGFLLNRMLFLMLNEAAELLNKEIASKEDIDKAMTSGAMHAMGPLKTIDLVGVDVTVSILSNLQKELSSEKFMPSDILLKMLKERKLGRKTKIGFYDYK